MNSGQHHFLKYRSLGFGGARLESNDWLRGRHPTGPLLTESVFWEIPLGDNPIDKEFSLSAFSKFPATRLLLLGPS